MENDSIIFKKCGKCGEKKPATRKFFAVEKRSKLGICAPCKMCKAAYKVTYYAEHREEYAEYRAAHREYMRKYNLEYGKANPDKVRIKEHRRRARQQEAEGIFTPADIERQSKAQKGKCYYCGNKCRLTIEHIVPLVRGGTNWPDNIVLACRSCNSSKSDKLPHEFAKAGRLL